MNGKKAFTCLRNSKKLASCNSQEYKSIYVIENLLPSNKKIFNYLYELKKQNKIYKVCSSNGAVFFNKSNTEFDYGQQVEHFDEINYCLNSTDSESDFVP